jgi:hypothetical protein
LKILGSVAFAVLAGYALHAFAQNRFEMRPAVTPIASSSSNGAAFAWFYDPSERAVYVCRMGPAPGDALDCKSKATLP